MDIHYWAVFISAALVINFSPGPDLVYIISRSLSQGVKVGIVSSLGIATGALVHVTGAAIGISAILTSSDYALGLIKALGAIFLVYLGVKQMISHDGGVSFEDGGGAISLGVAFKDGVLIDLLNPKVAIFFMVFLPQFTRDGMGAVPLQIFFLGLIVIVIGLIVEAVVVFFASSLRKGISGSTKLMNSINRVFGVALILIGVNIAFFH